jgi:hypothetical protein
MAPLVHVATPFVDVVVFGRPSPIAIFVDAFRNDVVLLHHFNLGSTVDEPVVSSVCTVIPLPQPLGAASKYLHAVPQSEPVDVKSAVAT